MRVNLLKKWAFLIATSLVLASITPVFAQTMGDKLAKKTQAGEDDRLLVEAKEIVYDNDKKTVSAIGDAQLYYQSKVLEADKVVYDSTTKRVTAIGHVRMRETTGEVGYGDFMELTNDFKDGFIRSLRVVRADKSRFASPTDRRGHNDFQ
jgi:LPS-assembly protein